MRPIDRVLERLEKVRRVGPGRYMACCPAHEDKTPSLSVRERDDGMVLLYDFGACCAHEEIAHAIGLEERDLFPEDLSKLNGKPRPAPRVPAADCLRILDEETLTAHLACRRLLALLDIDESDTEEIRLLGDIRKAAGRIGAIASAWEFHRGH